MVSLRLRLSQAFVLAASAIMLCWWTSLAHAELTDQTQTPNEAGAGILKSLEEQVGAGRGDVNTPNSSIFIIKRDPARSIRRGRQIFQRKWRVAQGFGPRVNDGIGNIEETAGLGAGLADACAGCHARPRGSAGFGGDVFTRPDSRDAPHLFGLGIREMVADEITQDLRAIRDDALSKAEDTGRAVTRDLESKGVDYGRITAFPDGSLDTSEVEGVDDDLRVKPFFAEGSVISMRQFAVGAFRDEMGLQAVDPDLQAASEGQDVTTPSGMVLTGSEDEFGPPPVSSASEDADGDGVANEVPTAIVDHLEFYLLNYFTPGTRRRTLSVRAGEFVFKRTGCADCHIKSFTIENDRRVANVATEFDSERGGPFNQLFATIEPLFEAVSDNTGFPAKKLPRGESFEFKGLFTDFKRHDLGPAFWEKNFDGTIQKKFMTEPLWGVGSTAPYGHDGRSIDLRQVILRHGGEAEESKNKFRNLPRFKQRLVLRFLRHLVLFPPDDTPSNTNPADPTATNFPQNGHGSINLGVLFNDPSEGE